jgi:hypothetical protein
LRIHLVEPAGTEAFVQLKPAYPLWIFFNASQLRIILPALRHQIYLWYNPGESVAHVTHKHWNEISTLEDILEVLQMEPFYLAKTPRLTFPVEELDAIESGFMWDRQTVLTNPWHGLLKARNLTLNERLQFLANLLQ